MKTFLFDVKLAGAIQIQAETEAQAQERLQQIFDCATVYAEENGETIAFEASIDGEGELAEEF